MLTDSQIQATRRPERPRKLSDGRGLFLLLAPNGGRYWRYNYRFGGKQKTLALGVYPDVTLAKARERHQVARRQLSEGADPSLEKKTATQSFEGVALEWHAWWKPTRSPRHANYVLKRLKADIFPEFGSMSLAKLSPTDFRLAVQKIENRGAGELARRALRTCGQVLRYAVANELIKFNPVAGMKPSDILKPCKRRHYARINAKELPDLLRAIDGYVGTEHTRLALQLMAVTFVRTSELIGARWQEFDLEEARWEIPKERMKMKSPLIVSLSRQALKILERLKEISFDRDLVFPGDVDPSKPMSNNTLLFALYRLGYRTRMTGHGFRGVASTILHEQGWPHEHIELQLAHQERDETSAAYNHALYLKPRALMMQAWSDYLDTRRNEKVIDSSGAN